MFIPKSMMPKIVAMITEYSKAYSKVLSDEDKELLNQMADRAALCMHGDAPFLEVEVCYSENPCANVKLPKGAATCAHCGAEIINGSCYNC